MYLFDRFVQVKIHRAFPIWCPSPTPNTITSTCTLHHSNTEDMAKRRAVSPAHGNVPAKRGPAKDVNTIADTANTESQ